MFSREIKWSEGFPDMVLSTEYSEAVNARYTFQPLWVSDRAEWSPVRSVIIRMITKLDDCKAEVQFVYHEYDYRPNWTRQSPLTNKS